MQIAATTRISALIKANPAAVEAIASVNRHFEKLRNPLLRKLLASRVTIADAARIGGCEVAALYEKLVPLGFTVSSDTEQQGCRGEERVAELPAFLAQLPPDNLLVLDVRPDIASGRDPFPRIMEAVETTAGPHALLLVNTFEPTPLISILSKKGFASFTGLKGPDLVHTYFWAEEKKAEHEGGKDESETTETAFEQLLTRFEGKLKRTDVRHLEMPQPMVTILEELAQLIPGEALYVTHRRVPLFLLPQLQERGFALASKALSPAEVHLIIYKS